MAPDSVAISEFASVGDALVKSGFHNPLGSEPHALLDNLP